MKQRQSIHPLGAYVLENTNQTLVVSTREEAGSNHRKWHSWHREPGVEWTFIPGCPGKLGLHHCPGIVINSTPPHSGKYLCFDNKLHNHPTYKEILLRKVQDNEAEKKHPFVFMVSSLHPFLISTSLPGHDTLSLPRPLFPLTSSLSPVSPTIEITLSVSSFQMNGHF